MASHWRAGRPSCLRSVGSLVQGGTGRSAARSAAAACPHETAVEAKALRDEAAEVNAELRSLAEHKNNIPGRQLDLRAWLCRELKLVPGALPFAGDLIAVRPEEADWEGAAERLLHSFALSVLVPDGPYAVVSAWINGHHLDAQLDPARIDVTAPDFAGRYGFLRKPGYVRFRGDAGFRGFSELSVRADEFAAAPEHVTCVYVAENEITYLAFPVPAGAMVIFGAGYAVPVLEPNASASPRSKRQSPAAGRAWYHCSFGSLNQMVMAGE